MKPILALFILFVMSYSLGAQLSLLESDGTIRTDNFEFYRPASIDICNDVNCKDTTGSIQVPRGTRFKFVSQNADGSIIIQLWEYPDPADVKKFNYVDAAQTIEKFYKVQAIDFTNKVIKLYSNTFITKGQRWLTGTSITSGVLILPYKLRPNIEVKDDMDKVLDQSFFDFSTDVSLGISMGVKQRMSKYREAFFNALFHIGVSNVSLTKYNTLDTLPESQHVPALTIATGVMFEFNSIQLGFFIGWDKVSDSQRNNWVYQGKPWYSIGLGVPLFSTSTNNSGEASGKQK